MKPVVLRMIHTICTYGWYIYNLRPIILYRYSYFTIDCKTPEQPTNGVVELTVDLLTTFGATAVVTCNTGYELRGDGVLLCKSNGVWSALPSCYIKGNSNQRVTYISAIGHIWLCHTRRIAPTYAAYEKFSKYVGAR